ncbi:MAG: hypothetical protein ACXWYO_01585 [Gaiellaceae bacterium]
MTTNQKPRVEVTADQQPPSQLELEDVTVGEGDEAAPGLVDLLGVR